MMNTWSNYLKPLPLRVGRWAKTQSARQMNHQVRVDFFFRSGSVLISFVTLKKGAATSWLTAEACHRILSFFGFVSVQWEEAKTRRPSFFMSIKWKNSAVLHLKLMWFYFYGDVGVWWKAERKEEGKIREEVHEEWKGGETQVTMGSFQIKLVWEREREWRDGGMKRRVKSMSHADGWGQRIQAEKIYGEYELL